MRCERGRAARKRVRLIDRSSALATVVAAVLAAGLGLSACHEDNHCVIDCGPFGGDYYAPTSPENLIHNLQEAYGRKEIERYADILAPEFVFKFQPIDVLDLGLDTWNRDQDSTGTYALFSTPLVGDIRIALVHPPSEPSVETFPTVEGEVRFIRVNPTQLEVDQIGGWDAGTTFRVDGDIQDMFFRRGSAAADEDTTRWFLFMWRDIPNPPGAGAKPGTASSAGLAATEKTTWGRIKTLFRIG